MLERDSVINSMQEKLQELEYRTQKLEASNPNARNNDPRGVLTGVIKFLSSENGLVLTTEAVLAHNSQKDKKQTFVYQNGGRPEQEKDRFVEFLNQIIKHNELDSNKYKITVQSVDDTPKEDN